ncbi:hypothetical protein [Aurantimonas sp. 22II-16-19i]|nr:hypothetical protein [Aurantimonas sp. 22II-16-19i]
MAAPATGHTGNADAADRRLLARKMIRQAHSACLDETKDMN